MAPDQEALAVRAPAVRVRAVRVMALLAVPYFAALALAGGVQAAQSGWRSALHWSA